MLLRVSFLGPDLTCRMVDSTKDCKVQLKKAVTYLGKRAIIIIYAQFLGSSWDRLDRTHDWLPENISVLSHLFSHIIVLQSAAVCNDYVKMVWPKQVTV